MERKIPYNKLEQAVNEAYDQYKDVNEGSVDPRVAGDEAASEFGIAVVLTDGRTIAVGDTKKAAPLGRISRVAVSLELLSQKAACNSQGKGQCCCASKAKESGEKPMVAFGAKSIREVSAVAPQNDADGKYQVFLDRIASMTEGTLSFNDNVYKLLSEEASAMKMAECLKDANYPLDEDAATAIDVLVKLRSLSMTAEQLAVYGATIAADCRNPRSGVYAYDGSLSQKVVTLMALRKVGRHCRKGWLMKTGLPGAASFSGSVLAVLPGFGAIAVYSPALNDNGVSVRAAGAVSYIARALELNVFGSARVEVE